jgi:5-methylthioadenosine/S-adenosylhomocysteine deaminase
MPDKTLFKGAAAVTMDPDLGTMQSADVLVEGDRIVAVAASIPGDDCEVVDAAGKVLIPGFVDTHRHLWMTVLRSLCSNMSTIEFLWSIRLQIAGTFTPADTYNATYVGALEALNAGVTTTSAFEHNITSEEDAREGIRAMHETGIRGIFGFGMLSPLNLRYGTSDWKAPADRLPILRELKANYTENPDSLVELGLSPGEFAIGGGETVVAEYEIAKELGLPVSHHAAAIAGTAASEIGILDDAGMLGEETLIVHGNDLGPEEYAVLKAAGSAVSAQMETEMGMALGDPTIVGQRAAGLEPTLGIDTVAVNSGDMLSQIRLALNFVCMEESKQLLGEGKNPVALTADCEDALAWGTIFGARALGMDGEIGSISPGKRADLVIVRRDGLMHAGGFSEDPAAAVVAQASVADIDSVMVNGSFVKRDGRMLDVDTDRAIARLEESRRRIIGDVPRTPGRNGYRSLIPDPPPELPLIEVAEA